MNFSSIRFCSALLAISALASAQSKQQPGLAASTQLIVVTAHDWDKVDGQLQRYERPATHKKWQPVGSPVTVALGKKGMGWGIGVADTTTFHAPSDPIKKEGDGKSPAGLFQLSSAFGYAATSESSWKMPYITLAPTVECVDDTGSKYYARVVDRSVLDHSGLSADWHSSEVMRKIDEYQIGLIILHNPNSITGGGSCIFMHIWDGPGLGTSGCTAMPREQLAPIIAWLDPAKNPLLVQMPTTQYKKIKRSWKLPALPKK